MVRNPGFYRIYAMNDEYCRMCQVKRENTKKPVSLLLLLNIADWSQQLARFVLATYKTEIIRLVAGNDVIKFTAVNEVAAQSVVYSIYKRGLSFHLHLSLLVYLYL